MSRQKLLQGFEKNLAEYQETQEKKKKLESKKKEEKIKEAEKRAQAEAQKKAKEAEGGAQIEEITDEEAERLMKKEEP